MKKKYNLIWLDSYGYVYERVMFIPRGRYWPNLTKPKWNRIDSIVKGVL